VTTLQEVYKINLLSDNQTKCRYVDIYNQVSARASGIVKSIYIDTTTGSNYFYIFYNILNVTDRSFVMSQSGFEGQNVPGNETLNLFQKFAKTYPRN